MFAIIHAFVIFVNNYFEKIHDLMNFPVDRINFFVYNNNCKRETESLPAKERKVTQMCNANNTIIRKVEELMELRKMADELNAEMETLIDAIKEHISDSGKLSASSCSKQ